jgi:hypothetical protein
VIPCRTTKSPSQDASIAQAMLNVNHFLVFSLLQEEVDLTKIKWRTMIIDHGLMSYKML